jgi:RHS repeat-associated protein
MINPEIFEFTGYINDINQEYTEVLITTDSEGNYRGAYTYANGERISVEDLGQVEGVPNDPLYYLYDALGTTAAITNMNAGIIDNNRFAPFGEPLSPVAKNSRLTNSPWGYTGESHDIEAGLVCLRARYYEPGTGRFIQQDTYPYFGEIEEPLTRNLYLYCTNNPLIYIDPTGHAKYTIGNPTQPEIIFDEDFKYDSTVKPTINDYLNWIKWDTILSGAYVLRKDLKDGLDAYAHYRGGTGEDMIVDYRKAYKEDSVIKQYVDNEILAAQKEAENYIKKVGNLALI